MKLRWYELITDGNSRPDHPEDNTALIEAESVQDAAERYTGKLWSKIPAGKSMFVKSVREVHYVFKAD